MKTLFFSLTLFFYLSQTFKEAKGQCNTLSYHPPEKPNQQTPEHFVIPKPKSETEKLFSKPNLPFSDDDDDDDNDNDPSLKADKGILNSYIFQFLSVRARSPVLDAAISRYKEKIFLPCWSTSILQNRNLSSSSSSSSSSKRDFSKGNEFPILGLRIAVSERQEMRLGEEMLEYYHLEIDPFSDGWAFLSAPSVWGALRGLETFSQLVRCDFHSRTFFVPHIPFVVEDSPRFSHRGLMIDTGSHFLPVPIIKKVVDGMEAVKLNVLHWHIVGAQSFPAPMNDEFQELEKGAFSEVEKYSAVDIKEVVSYASYRGIRVMPEYNVPGKTYSWGVGYPNLLACKDGRRSEGFCRQNPCGQLDPSEPQTYDMVKSVMNYSSAMFSDPYFHAGGDDFFDKCWENDAKVKSWMIKNGLDTNATYGHFISEVSNNIERNGKKAVFWDDAFLRRSLSSTNTIVQVWHPGSMIDSVTAAGHKAIASSYGAWFLGCGEGDWCPYCTWRDMYEYDPFSPWMTSGQKERVIGGEGVLWGERVDEYNIETKLWPRLAAIAEKLWSPITQSENTIDEFYERLLNLRCVLLRRGIKVEPLEPGSSPFICHHSHV